MQQNRYVFRVSSCYLLHLSSRTGLLCFAGHLERILNEASFNCIGLQPKDKSISRNSLHEMPVSKDSLSSIPTCYATVSVGTPNHDLEEKLKAIAGAGFQGIELGFSDLLSFASKNLGRDVGPQEFDILCNSGLEVKRVCTELGLKIVMLQPFSKFEGWKPQSAERKDAFKRAKGWIRIMEAVGTDMLQVGHQFLSYTTHLTYILRLGRLYRFSNTHSTRRSGLGSQRTRRPTCSSQLPPGLRELVLVYTRS